MKTNAVNVYVRATAVGLEVDQITKEHFHISVWLKGVCNGPLCSLFFFSMSKLPLLFFLCFSLFFTGNCAVLLLHSGASWWRH